MVGTYNYEYGQGDLGQDMIARGSEFGVCYGLSFAARLSTRYEVSELCMMKVSSHNQLHSPLKI